jgi:hypothetical protein
MNDGFALLNSNLSYAVNTPSPEHAKIINGWLDELKEKIEGIRYKLH